MKNRFKLKQFFIKHKCMLKGFLLLMLQICGYCLTVLGFYYNIVSMFGIGFGVFSIYLILFIDDCVMRKIDDLQGDSNESK